jgi:hypothetical protein
MKLAVLIGLAMAAAAQPASATNWRYVTTIDDTTTYLDMDSIAKSSTEAGSIQFWTHDKTTDSQTNNAWIGRCDTHSMGIVHMMVYQNGGLTKDGKMPLDFFMPMVMTGASLGRQTLEMACGQRTAGAKAEGAVDHDVSWQHPVL